ncbi:alpha/beta hydrolase fold domain-containing protein [Sphingomonas sp. MG17]|uniref:Alpha/beta hydrolase fold domain-containing protein n=1 Tax=Sphingomonas tagetis TaxID=2949092 RepID=A0A9X2HP23_9SPHN|nr:alpha/beta hydrolase fold domain-containing protein [Sphingomonas tagetis]MCP3730908.1 alpha/beta hydrolase fold domain-containing protein [Sphingomonas tagetis]
MNDGLQLEPGIRRFLDEMRAEWRNHPPFETLSFPEQRQVAEQVRARWTSGGPVMARTTDRVLDPGAGELPLRIYLPEGVAEPAPALVYLHGGGFTLFSIETHDRLMREYAAQGGFAVIGVDYPLAPEAKYPVALDRIEALMLWLHANGRELGIDPDRLAMGGDSAGANLSFATTLRLRERGLHGIVRAILSNYGGFSARLSDEAEAKFGGPGSIMDRAEAEQYYANYLNDAGEADDPFACPINADLTGFPPVFLCIPECDIVTEQSVAMDARLRAAGVETASKLYRGAIHSFLEAMSVSALAREAIADGADFVASKLEAR